MAEFDFNALLEDPKFAFGLSLLGGANPKNAPLLQALQMTQLMKKNKLAQEKEKREAELDQERAALYKAQVQEISRKAQSAQAAQALQQEWVKGLGTLLQPGSGAMQQPPEPPQLQAPPPQAPIPQEPKPMSWLKPEWEQKWIGAESEGNQINPKTGLPLTSPKGAVGISQVLPSTGPEAAKLAGLPWDARRLAYDADYNKQLGKAYLDQQFKTFNGNPAHAFAAYNAGPEATRKALEVAEKAKRPDIWLSLLPAETRKYVHGILGEQPPTPTEDQKAKMFPPSSPLGLRNPGLPLAIHAAKGAALGIKGAKEFVDVAKMMEPKSVAAGSYQQDAEGNLSFIPNPDKQEELRIQRERLENDKIEREVKSGKITQELAADKSKAFQAVENVDMTMQRLKETAAQLKDHPGLKMITGVTGGLINPRLLGTDARNAAAVLETLKAQVFVNATTALRQASPTGAGVGNQSDKEGDKLEASKARLNQAQSLKEFKDALDDLIKQADSSRGILRKTYEMGFEGGKSTAPKTEPLPPGAKQIGTSKGKPVYETPDGKRFVVQ